MARARVYITPFLPDGSGPDDELEITRDVLAQGFGTIQTRIEKSDYDLGLVNTSDWGFALRNDNGRYHDPDTDPASRFVFSRNGTPCRVTWDLADYDSIDGLVDADYAILSNETTAFKGVISDLATVMGLRDFTVGLRVLGREFLLRSATVSNSGLGIANGQTAKAIMEAMLDQAEITDHLTFDADSVAPANNVTVDDVSGFDGKTVAQVLDELLTASNSVFYVDGDTMTVAARTPSADVVKTFYGREAGGPEDIVDLSGLTNGANRMFNYVTWRDTALVSQDTSMIQKYGRRSRQLALSSITNTTTRQSILDALRVDFATPRREFDVKVLLSYDSMALKMLDRVAFDLPAMAIGGQGYSYYDIDEYDVGRYADELSFELTTTEHYAVIAKTVDLLGGTVQLRCRRIP